MASEVGPKDDSRPKAKGKWGAFMSGGAQAARAESSVESSIEKEDSKETSHPPLSRMGKIKAITAGPAATAPPGNGNKVFPVKKGAPVINAGRQETIDELTETASTGSPSKSPEIRTVRLPPPLIPSVSPSAVTFPGTTSPEYQQILANMQDFKVDVKLEIQRLNQKMNKLEDLLGDIVNKLNQQLNGPNGSGGGTSISVVPPTSTSSSVTFAQTRLLSPTSPCFPTSPFHSHSERDTSPASGEEREGHRRHRGHHHHKHHKHRDRDKDRRRDSKDSKEKTPDTLSPGSSRKSSADLRSPSRSTDREKKKDRKRSKAPAPPTTATTSTSRTTTDAVKKMLEEEIEEQSSSKNSSAGSKEPLIPGKPIYPTGSTRSQEFL
jgi:hypothetical protein